MMTLRSERTKARLQQAFVDLLQEKSLAEISMADVAQKAACHRTTAYRHYPNTEALLLNCFDRVSEEVKEGVVFPDGSPGKSPSAIAYANLVLFYNHAAKHRHLYQALLNSAHSTAVRRRFRRIVAGSLFLVTEQAGTLTILPAPADVVCNLVAEMVVGALAWWLDTESEHTPELLAEMTVRLGETGLFGLTGQVPTEEDISFQPFSANGEHS